MHSPKMARNGHKMDTNVQKWANMDSKNQVGQRVGQQNKTATHQK